TNPAGRSSRANLRRHPRTTDRRHYPDRPDVSQERYLIIFNPHPQICVLINQMREHKFQISDSKSRNLARVARRSTRAAKLVTMSAAQTLPAQFERPR